MIILGIETSCDETAAAIVDGERTIRANLVLSQLKEHEAFGGVVPEIAARSHLDHLNTLIKAALIEAKITFDDLDGVAATCGPGLIGGLLVGMMAGKAIAAAKDIPFLAVNHLEGHALTPRLTDNVEFPYLLLLVSGGHTQILVAEDVGQYKRWGTTLDDAAGECFDKSAKLMGLPYPGGPQVEKLAAKCVDKVAALKRFDLPRPMQHRKEPDFSFSGLKTAVRMHVESLPEGALTETDAADLSYSLQTAIAEILAERTNVALKKFVKTYKMKNPSLVVSGGVAANLAVRAALQKLDAKLYAPPLHLCSDNAAMIAWAGLERLRKNMRDSLDFKARPRWPLDPDAEPRQGAGVKA
jgi:N6-L-threonylcarbamoyladenine synthase